MTVDDYQFPLFFFEWFLIAGFQAVSVFSYAIYLMMKHDGKPYRQVMLEKVQQQFASGEELLFRGEMKPHVRNGMYKLLAISSLLNALAVHSAASFEVKKSIFLVEILFTGIFYYTSAVFMYFDFIITNKAVYGNRVSIFSISKAPLETVSEYKVRVFINGLVGPQNVGSALEIYFDNTYIKSPALANSHDAVDCLQSLLQFPPKNV